MKFLPLFTALFMVTAGHAQSTTTSTYKSTWTQLEESPFSLTYGILGETTRRESDSTIKGMNIYHDFLLSYDLTAKDELRLTPELFNLHGGGTVYGLTELRYKRKALWTQEDDGFDVSFQQRYIYYNDRSKEYAFSSTRFYIDRTLSEQLAWNNVVRYDVTHDTSATAFGSNTLFLDSTPAWAVNDQIAAGMTFRYTHTTPREGVKENVLTMIPNLTYSPNERHGLSFAAYVPTMKSGDGNTFAKNAGKDVLYELTYTLSVF